MFALALLVVVAPGAGDLPAAATATAAQPQALPHKAMNMYALLPERALPAEQVASCYDEARACYEAWLDRDDRTPY